MRRILPLRNTVQEYAWGSFTFLQDFLSLPMKAGERPMAELWMGAHPAAPSRAEVEGDWVPLDRLIERDPEGILGKPVARAFGNRLPFLFKVLAVGRPLSIQVHPDENTAREGFEREESAGLTLNDPRRCYRDPFPKPELLCALTPFRALKGVRPAGEMIERLRDVVPRALSEEIRALKALPEKRGIRRLWAGLMNLSPERRAAVTQEARMSTRDAGAGTAEDWVNRLAEAYPGDAGLLSPVILNLVHLEPGEAIYVPPGELHAYLEGVGLELMANSDNVIRGGLTVKHVERGALMRVADFRPGAAMTVLGSSLSPEERIYPSPAREFALSRISVAPGRDWKSKGHRGVEIVLCLQGKGAFHAGNGEKALPFSRGDSVIVPASAPLYEIRGEALLARATVPG